MIGSGRSRLVLADDHPVALEGMSVALGKVHDVVGTVLRLRDLESEVDRLAPDLLVTDLAFRGEGNALPLIRAGVERGTIRCPFLVLSAMESRAQVAEVYRAGAAGYVAKGARVEEVRAAVEAALRGERTFPPGVELSADETPAPDRYQQTRVVEVDGIELTERELAILLDFHRGVARNEIARRMGIKPRDVEYHFEEVRRRIEHRRSALLMVWLNEQIDALRAAARRI